jgi:hypothetical protein
MLINLAHRYTQIATTIRNTKYRVAYPYEYNHAWDVYWEEVQPLLQRVGQLIGAGCVPKYGLEVSKPVKMVFPPIRDPRGFLYSDIPF